MGSNPQPGADLPSGGGWMCCGGGTARVPRAERALDAAAMIFPGNVWNEGIFSRPLPKFPFSMPEVLGGIRRGVEMGPECQEAQTLADNESFSTKGNHKKAISWVPLF